MVTASLVLPAETSTSASCRRSRGSLRWVRSCSADDLNGPAVVLLGDEGADVFAFARAAEPPQHHLRSNPLAHAARHASPGEITVPGDPCQKEAGRRSAASHRGRGPRAGPRRRRGRCGRGWRRAASCRRPPPWPRARPGREEIPRPRQEQARARRGFTMTRARLRRRGEGDRVVAAAVVVGGARPRQAEDGARGQALEVARVRGASVATTIMQDPPAWLGAAGGVAAISGPNA
jgi:hypothetical protein